MILIYKIMMEKHRSLSLLLYAIFWYFFSSIFGFGFFIGSKSTVSNFSPSLLSSSLLSSSSSPSFSSFSFSSFSFSYSTSYSSARESFIICSMGYFDFFCYLFIFFLIFFNKKLYF